MQGKMRRAYSTLLRRRAGNGRRRRLGVDGTILKCISNTDVNCELYSGGFEYDL
jgi:hypothetical protein